MYIIAGLGNPTAKYQHTRHNVGFDALDLFAEKHGIAVDERKHQALCGSGTIDGEKVLLMKPQTFMNLSGESIGAAVRFYKLDPATQLLVLYDDIELAPGCLRIREKGSAGGHNGMKNIIAQVGTEQFARIRIGIGQKPPGWDLADYVLGHFSKEERTEVEQAMADASAAIEWILKGKIGEAMNRYNRKKS